MTDTKQAEEDRRASISAEIARLAKDLEERERMKSPSPDSAPSAPSPSPDLPVRWSPKDPDTIARREAQSRELVRAVEEADAFMPEDGPDKLQKFIDDLMAGLPEKHALASAGIPKKRFDLYMKHGAFASSGTPIRLWYEKVMQCAPKQIRTAIKAVHGAIDSGDWKAAAWLLARLDPDAFGEQQTLKIRIRDQVRELLEKVVGIIADEVTDPNAIARIDTRFRTELGEFAL